MGNINGSNINYGILKERESGNESKSLRHELHDEFTEYSQKHEEGNYNLYQMFEHSCKKYESNIFLGTRRLLSKENGLYSPYEFKKYSQIRNTTLVMADSIYKDNLYSKFNEKSESLILLGILSKNREEYIVSEFACHYLGITVIPIFETLNDTELIIILNETKLEVLCVDLDQFQKILKFGREKKLICLTKIILFDDEDSEINIKMASEIGIKIFFYNDMIKKGKPCEKKILESNPDSTAILCYTGWTLERPKAAKLSHRSILSYIYAMSYCLNKKQNNHTELLEETPNEKLEHLNEEDKLLLKDPNLCKDIKKILSETYKPNEDSFSDKDIYFSYISLANSIERIIITLCIHNGLSIGFYSGESKRLFEDIQSLNPTIFFGPPRIYIKINDALKEIIHNLKLDKKSLVEKGIKSKTENFQKTGQLSHYLWDKLVFNKFKRLMGDKLKFMLTTSSLIPDSILDFLKICFSCPIIQGYSQTEFLAAALFTNPYDYTSGHAGGPALSFEIKLVDLPKLGYYSTDYKNNEDRPRGEIYLKGPSLFSGYLYEDNKQFIDNNGWTKTGVIGMLDFKNNSVKVIDKIENLIDLKSEGVIEPERLENIYVNSKYVKQIFIQDYKSEFLIALIIPNKEEVHSFLKGENEIVSSITSTNKRKLSFEREDKKSIKSVKERRNTIQNNTKKQSEINNESINDIDICKDNSVNQEILTNLNYTAKIYNLRKCEYIKKIILISEGLFV